MLGRAATRIELNRDADLDELEQVKAKREQEQERALLGQQQHQPFGARQVRGTPMHSIFTNESSSSGFGGPSMIQMPGFQPHNLTDHQEVIMPQGGATISSISGSAGGQSVSGGLMVYPGTHHSQTPAAQRAQQQMQRPAHGSQTQSYQQQHQQHSMHPPNFHPPQNPNQNNASDSSML